MNNVIIIFLAVIFSLNGLNSKVIDSKKSKFVEFDFKDLSLNSNGGRNSDGPYCNSLTAYFVGALKNKKSPESFNVQFQLKLWTDQRKQKIFVKADEWNDKYSDHQDFELDFYVDGSRKWCDIYSECSIPFAKKTSAFKVDLNNAAGNYFHLLQFNNFNNTFGLVGSVDQCTKHQLDGVNDDNTPDLNQLNFCVCCDEYEPAELLGCPNDKWGDEGTTQKPTPPPTRDIQCKSVVGYYSGTFKNGHGSNATLEFQTRLKANDKDKKVSFTVDRWNTGKDSMNLFELYAYHGTSWKDCYPINSNDCTIPYASQTEQYFYLDFYDHRKNWFDFLYFPNFNNTFTLTNAIGQCTNNQFYFDSTYEPNTELYKYCVCCGDNYSPDEALNCPRNQWA